MNRTLRTFTFSLISAVTAGVLLIPVNADASDPLGKLDQVLLQSLQAGTPVSQNVIIRALPGQRASVRDQLKALGDVVNSEYPTIEALAAQIHTADLSSLAAASAVLSISTNATVLSLVAPASSGATAAVLRATQGLTSTSPTGKGIGVAIIDSGIAPSKDFGSRIVAFYDFLKGGSLASAYDDFGSGTHVAGLIGSGGALGSQYQGVAPNVRIVAMKVLGSQGSGRTSEVISAITFATANKQLLGIDIISLPLGHPIYESAATDPLVQAVEAAVRAGIVVVTSAGNLGLNPTTKQPGYAGVTCPGKIGRAHV